VIVRNARVVTLDAANRVLENAEVEIGGDGTIKRVDAGLGVGDQGLGTPGGGAARRPPPPPRHQPLHLMSSMPAAVSSCRP
jgi:hypothetical protein